MNNPENLSVLPLEATTTATSLISLGSVAQSIILSLKERSRGDDGRGEARTMSLADIASALGIPKTTAAKHMSDMYPKPADAEADAGPRPYYSYTLSDMVKLREHMNLARHHAPGVSPAVLCVVNFKGGVGKSTTATHIAVGLARKGLRVCLVDNDPQGSASTLCGFHPDLQLGRGDTLIPYFVGEESTIDYAIKATDLHGLSVIPAHLALADADRVIPERQDREVAAGTDWVASTLLVDAIETVKDQFDVVIVDCPPTMSYLTTMAIQAADAILCPLRPMMLDLASSAQFVRMLGALQSDTDLILGSKKRFAWLRFLITQNEAKRSSRDLEGYIRTVYGNRVLGATFGKLEAVALAAGKMRTVYDVSQKGDLIGRASLKKAIDVVDELCDQVEALLVPVMEAKLAATLINQEA